MLWSLAVSGRLVENDEAVRLLWDGYESRWRAGAANSNAVELMQLKQVGLFARISEEMDLKFSEDFELAVKDAIYFSEVSINEFQSVDLRRLILDAPPTGSDAFIGNIFVAISVHISNSDISLGRVLWNTKLQRT